MGGCQSQNAVACQEIEPLIIMWILKISDFLRMELPLPKHEELQAQNLLHQRQTDSYCLFVSHQWISFEHPDPEGKQLLVLQRCLQNISDGRIGVRNDAASQFFGDYKVLSKAQRTRISNGYIWLDWISIPQIETFRDDDSEDEVSIAKRQRSSRTFSYRGPSKTRRTDQEDYILSIPSFVQACQVFVALVPPLLHLDSKELCDYSSWSLRGWCRTELWCKMMLGNQDTPMVVISAADQADFARPTNWVDCLPHEGQFSVHADRAVVNGIFEQALNHQLSWLEHEADLSLYRYFLARRENLIGASRPQRTPLEFLQDFGFCSLQRARRCRFGPMAAAALSGDVDLLKSLLESKCPLNQQLPAMPEVGFPGGLTALHVVVMQGWRSPVLKILLEARADPSTAASGIPLLACCRTAKDVELLVSYRADACQKAWPLKVPALSLASGEPTKPEVIAKLLEYRASPEGPQVSGLGTAQPLALLCVNANSNTHANAIAELLLEARADVNQRGSATGLFYGLELANRAYLQVAPGTSGRSSLMEFIAEWSTTPLGVASMLGRSQLVQRFLDAKGDVNVKNARGHTPLQLARTEQVKQIFQRHLGTADAADGLPQLEDLQWRPEEWEAPTEQPPAIQPSETAAASSPGSTVPRAHRSSPGSSVDMSEPTIITAVF